MTNVGTERRPATVSDIATDPRYLSDNPFEDLLAVVRDMIPDVMPAARKNERLLGFLFALSHTSMRVAAAGEDAGWTVEGVL